MQAAQARILLKDAQNLSKLDMATRSGQSLPPEIEDVLRNCSDEIVQSFYQVLPEISLVEDDDDDVERRVVNAWSVAFGVSQGTADHHKILFGALAAMANLLPARDYGLSPVWFVTPPDSRGSAEHHQVISASTAAMYKLPPGGDDGLGPLPIYKLHIWIDTLIEEYPGLRAAFITFQTVNRWLSQEMHAVPGFQHPHVAYNDTFAIRVMRGALETAETSPQLNPPEIFIPAAVQWISILGPQMYSWAKQSSYQGDFGEEGTGGPLWHGRNGYCIERWKFWKQRFNDLSSSELVNQQLRDLTKKGATKISEVESEHPDYKVQDRSPTVTAQTHPSHGRKNRTAERQQYYRKWLEEEQQRVAETESRDRGKHDETRTITQQVHVKLPPISSTANQAEMDLTKTKATETRGVETMSAETKQAKTYADCVKDY